MHVRKITARDLEPHRVGAGGEEECAIGVSAAIRQLYTYLFPMSIAATRAPRCRSISWSL